MSAPSPKHGVDQLPSWMAGLPPTIFIPKIHPLREDITQDVNAFFLAHWPFPNEKARKKFVESDFCYALCATWPESLDDRMRHACRLVTLVFLIDDLLDDMSLEEGQAFNNAILSLLQGHRMPNQELNAVESIACDIWADLRASDPGGLLSQNILAGLMSFMAAQTDAVRTEKNIGLKAYLQWRKRDAGGPIITATGLYCTGLTIPMTDLAVAESLHEICMNHIVYGNDAWSYDKELKKAQETADHGPVQAFSSVSSLMDASGGITSRCAKRVLVFLQREMEVLFAERSDEVLRTKDTPEMRRYIKMLEYQMSGSELWGTKTLRYYESGAA